MSVEDDGENHGMSSEQKNYFRFWIKIEITHSIQISLGEQ